MNISNRSTKLGNPTMIRFFLLSLPVLVQAFQGRLMCQRGTRLFAIPSWSSDTVTPMDSHSFSKPTFPSKIFSRRDVVNTVAAGSFLAAAVASGVQPALAEEIDKQVQALEREFKDSVNSNGAPEKHIPNINLGEIPGKPELRLVEVVVPHVMDAEKPHFIQAIWLKEEKSGDVAVAKVLPATEPSPPKLKCGVPKGVTLTPYLFCNLHGLWKGETFTV